MNDITAHSVSELMTLREEVEAAIAAKAHDEIRSIEQQINSLTAQREKLTAAYGTPKKQRKSSAQTETVVKFRHPETGQTWSGKGRVPGWLIEARQQFAEVELLAA